ncbi:hypothetical protein ACFQZX_06805 [Mucilaginibacter litoreus]|uniref:Outer membrane lipoprotein-sorting protein n=1 Tax=Mucilaginibacter litoreus TaxID=1048221 RepID=A0ABW3AQM1_9SPHI
MKLRTPVYVLCVAIVLSVGFTPSKQPTSTDIIKKMYNRYHGKWHSSLAFTQTTGRYRNDSLIKTDTWQERILYPDRLRIDFGDPALGNGVIYRADSSYLFRSNKIMRAAKDENELIFFLGGLYFKPLQDVLAHFKALNFDLNKFHESTWKGKAVYVLGAVSDNEKVTQLWIDAGKLVPVRYFKYATNGKMEATFEEHKMIAGAWSETFCKFYINDKLLQTETYTGIKANQQFDQSIFEPSQIGK